ncbi:MAG: HAD-IC family P-type ATPase [Candidatus Nealsonbacteria bacterium]|nr:HAD-IC family P-type ATPase [Candidatus Nealsonbacteria bacterium]
MSEKILWHGIGWQDAVIQLDSNAEQGLPEKEAVLRQKKFGPNQLPEEEPASRVRILLDQIKTPLIYILIIAGIITLIFQKWADSIVIFGAVALNAFMGFYQENKANQALRALKKMVKIEAQVIREGRERNIDAADLVPGDIVVLTSGNKIPADGRLIMAHHLMAQEASLTGEWLASPKNIDVLPQETFLADRENMVYMGCTVENGKGMAIVTAIGKDSKIGEVAALVGQTKEEKTPLQNKIIHFSKIVTAVIAFLAVFIFLEGVFRGRDFLEMFMTSIAVAVAAIPEGLPVALTVILAIGMQRILKRHGLVRKLIAAEILGGTSVIASDKTLTLTQGKMRVAEIAGDDPALLLQIAVLTSEGFIENPGDPYHSWIIKGRPTDKALILAGAEAGFEKPILDKAYAKIDEIPFNHENKFIAALVQAKPLIDGFEPIINGSDQAILVSGAPEKILNHSYLQESDLSKLKDELKELTGKGLRVVASAYKKIANHKTEITNLKDEIDGLTFVGFIGLADPLRPEAKEAISSCKEAGLKPIIVTGDHLFTAKAVASELGLKIEAENIIEGGELDKISDEEFQKRIRSIDVYARVEPHHKLRIVEAWQKQGDVVAMTGDGINDTPALKKADIGIALGSGTDAAKEVSDLVLLTDNFNVILAAVEEGRIIIDNIRKIITYLLSDSFTETILIGMSIFLGWPLPISAVQILWINLIEDGFPNMALAFEPKEEDVLKRKPEGKEVKLLTPTMKTIIFIIGIITDFLLLGIFWWFLGGNYDIQYIRTIIFTALGIDSLFYVFSCKSLRKNLWRTNLFSNKFLIISVIFGFAMLFAALYVPVFQALLKTTPLGVKEWLIVLGLGIVNVLLIELVKYIFIIRHKAKA